MAYILCQQCGQKIQGFLGLASCPNCNGLISSSASPRETSSSASAQQHSGRSLAALQSALSEAQQVREQCYLLGKDREGQAADEMCGMLAALVWTLQAQQAQREALTTRELPSGWDSRATADWQWEGQGGYREGDQIRMPNGQILLIRKENTVYWCEQTREMVMEDYSDSGKGFSYRNQAMPWDEVKTRLERGGEIKQKASIAAPKQASKSPSSFFLHITQPPCFAHGIGGRSYSQICSSADGKGSAPDLSGLEGALSSLQASEKWRTGHGEP